MLSGILNSPRAIEVNIAIMRIFTKLRSFLLLEQELREKLNNLEDGANKMFRIVFERLDSIEEIITPKIDQSRKRIGLKSK
jgi:hypothetical protein